MSHLDRIFLKRLRKLWFRFTRNGGDGLSRHHSRPLSYTTSKDYNAIMRDKPPFVSIPNEIDIFGESPSKRPDVDTLKCMAYLGQSTSHRIYWNKMSSSFGLLCGSSEFEDRISDTLQIGKINSVARVFVRSHLEKEPGARTCPRVLLFHTGNHTVHKSSPALLDAENMTVLISPRVVQSTTQAMGRHAPRPLRFSEDDISLHHVLALFSPPPEMDYASASRILATVQYVISQLPTDSPFDLQTFIQLIEQEKWDDEGSAFIALRQTLLTGLLASYEDDFENNSIRLPLKSLDKVLLELTDPILCSTRLDGVLMDMALHAFLKPSVDQNEKTMIILSAADEYLHGSSPLLRSLCSLASEESRNINVLVMTTNLSSLALLPNFFDALDYVALAGPVHSSTWLETIRTHWISIGWPEPLPRVLSRNMLEIISPDSQMLESTQDGERWTSWECGYICAEIDESLSVISQSAVTDDVVEVAERPCAVDLGGSTKAITAAISDPVAEVAEVRLDQSSPPEPFPSPNRGPSRPQQNTVIAQDNDSDSEESSGGRGSLEVGIRPIDASEGLLHNGTFLRPDLVPFFHIPSDLPPEAYIKASVGISMYPDEFSLLTEAILRLSGGYSNVEVAKKGICAIIRPFMTTMKRRGSPLPFNNCDEMIAKAWSVHILRYSTNGPQTSVFLVNTQNAVDRLNLCGVIGTQPLSRNTITRTVSPYMPLVQSLAYLTGNSAAVPVLFKSVRKKIGQVMVRSLGFPNFAQYVEDARLVGLVTKQGTGNDRAVSLRADWSYLQSLLVLPPDCQV